MRPTPPFPQISCSAHAAECGLAVFRRMPRAADVPAEEAVAARQEVALGEVVLPNGFVLGLSMMDARLGRKPTLHMRLFDTTGRAAIGPILNFDQRRAQDMADAFAAYLSRVVPSKSLFAEVKRGWQGAAPEGEAA